jgi:hypothetical protein
MQGSNNIMPEGVGALVELLGSLTGLTDLKILYLVSDEGRRFFTSSFKLNYRLIAI